MIVTFPVEEVTERGTVRSGSVTFEFQEGERMTGWWECPPGLRQWVVPVSVVNLELTRRELEDGCG